MTDMVFDLRGSSIPGSYAFALWYEVARCLPWLATEEVAGILPLRGSMNGASMLLPQRAKLVLRLPAEFARQAALLSGQQLRVESSVLPVGAGRERPLQAYPTLHAHMVESDKEEEAFLADVAAQLREMDVACQWICGKRRAITGMGQSLSGYSLVLHDLQPEESLRVQHAGLGGSRRFGCGIFVPHKAITGLG